MAKCWCASDLSHLFSYWGGGSADGGGGVHKKDLVSLKSYRCLLPWRRDSQQISPVSYPELDFTKMFFRCFLLPNCSRLSPTLDLAGHHSQHSLAFSKKLFHVSYSGWQGHNAVQFSQKSSRLSPTPGWRTPTQFSILSKVLACLPPRQNAVLLSLKMDGVLSITFILYIVNLQIII